MTKVRVTVNVPEYGAAAVTAGDFITEAEELRASIVRRALPEGRTASVELIEVGDTVTSLDSNDITAHRFTATGAAAGDVTVTGITTSSILVAVVGALNVATDAGPPTVTDYTSEFTITAAGKINNVGGTSTSGQKLSVVWLTVAGV